MGTEGVAGRQQETDAEPRRNRSNGDNEAAQQSVPHDPVIGPRGGRSQPNARGHAPKPRLAVNASPTPSAAPPAAQNGMVQGSMDENDGASFNPSPIPKKAPVTAARSRTSLRPNSRSGVIRKPRPAARPAQSASQETANASAETRTVRARRAVPWPAAIGPKGVADETSSRALPHCQRIDRCPAR